MVFSWLASMALIWAFPSSLALWNPFLAPISLSIVRRNLPAALWGCFLTGCLQDLLLASPRFGILALSSLLSGALAFRIVRLFPIDGFQGTFLATILAALQGILDVLLCSLLGFSDSYSFFELFVWKKVVLSIVFSTCWAFALCGLRRMMFVRRRS
jgi:hypothetical protein